MLLIAPFKTGDWFYQAPILIFTLERIDSQAGGRGLLARIRELLTCEQLGALIDCKSEIAGKGRFRMKTR